jgi:hypothetical protein
MTPKEKAKELLDKFEYCTYDAFADDYGYSNRKDAAIIAVDEIIKVSTNSQNSENYWRQVKQEIEKL